MKHCQSNSLNTIMIEKKKPIPMKEEMRKGLFLCSNLSHLEFQESFSTTALYNTCFISFHTKTEPSMY